MVNDQQQELATQGELLTRLRQERDNLKLAAEAAPARTAQLQQQIDQLIDQIDGTLAQLPPETPAS